MSNSIAPGSSADVNVRVNALTTNPNVPVTYKTIILKKNLVNGVNTLTQEMMSATNTKYVIKYDYVLGEDITIPAGCILEFDGGSLNNGSGNTYKIYGNNASINLVDYYIFKNVEPVNFQFPYLNPKWFGAKGDYDEVNRTGTDDAAAFETCLNLINNYYNGAYIYIVGRYYINTPITTTGDFNLKGEHCFSRDLTASTYHSDITSPSIIVVGSCTAFTLNGRGDSSKFANSSVKNIKIVGKDIETSVFMYVTTSDAPSRNFIIEECEFTRLNKCIAAYGKNTVIYPLVINKVYAYVNRQFLWVEKSVEGNTATIGGLTIKDSTIEHNGENAIYVNGAMGFVSIKNNLLEGQVDPIVLKEGSHMSVEIVGNYFEANGRVEIVDGQRVTHPGVVVNCQGGEFSMKDNFFMGLGSETISLRRTTINELDTYWLGEGCILDKCTIKCKPIGFRLSWISNYCRFMYNVAAYPDSLAYYDSLILNRIPAREISSTTKAIDGTFNADTTYYFGFVADNSFTFSFGSVGSGVAEYPDKNTFIVMSVSSTSSTDRFSFTKIAGYDTYNVAGFRQLTQDYELENINIQSIDLPMTGRRDYMLFNKPKGFSIFDTKDNNNKPIWWNGSAWVDATGATV